MSSKKADYFGEGIVACNHFKSDYWQTRADRQLLHPLRDTLLAHCVLMPDFTVMGLTPRGRNHIEVLHLNRAELIEYRRLQVEREREHEEYLSLLDLFHAQGAELEMIARRLRELTSESGA